jgi:predicted O-linked N-acetylglucosamine transferase (SPINDLY family)
LSRPIIARDGGVNGDSEFDRAVELQRAGRAAEAEALCRSILARGDDARALHLLGTIRFGLGAHVEGIDLLRRAVDLRPDYAEAEFNLGAMLAAVGRLSEATDHYGRAAALNPLHIDAQARLAAVLMAQTRTAEAEAACLRVLELQPDDVAALTDLTVLAFTLRKVDAAVEYGRRAVALAPNLAVAHVRLGRALKERGQFEEAIALYRRALELDPESADAANFLAVVLHESVRLDEAEEVGRLSVTRRPNDPVALNNLAIILQAKGEIEAALDLYGQALKRSPERLDYRRNMLNGLLYAPDVTPDERFAANQAFARSAAAKVTDPLPPPANAPVPGRKLRVGWISSDFRQHPVARNLELFFTHRDRSRFEAICYMDVPAPDEVTEWFRGQSDSWRSIVGLTDDAVARQIRDDGIDIMVYLAGRFDRNRPQVAAWRPAQVQISLFDGASSGMPEMDYFIADAVTVPPRSRRVEQFSERPLRLPNFYLHTIPVGGPTIVPPPCLAAGHVTFGSFNNPTKLNGRLLAVWADLLRRVPGARLRLKFREWFGNRGLRERVLREFGDVADRVEFDPADRPLEQHLALYNQIDIALDPFPFNGSTTTFEALWMGVPVVTLAGDSFMSRWTAGMLSKLGLTELVADTRDDYIDRIVTLAADTPRLTALRAGLRERVARSALCDGRRTTRYLERAFMAVWRRWCRAATASETKPYSFASDDEYLSKLRHLVESGAVRIDMDTGRLKAMDSPVGYEADTERWAMAMVAVVGTVWWFVDTTAAGAAAVLSVLAYTFVGRRQIGAAIKRRIHDKALVDIQTWRALWRFGGITLVAQTPAFPAAAVCAAPDDSWIRFVEQAVRPPAAAADVTTS